MQAHGEGYAFNQPMYAVKTKASKTGCGSNSLCLFEVDPSDHVILETVKKCEHSDEYILRLYESHNDNAECTLSSFKNLEYAYECDMMEENIKEIPVEANRLTFKIAPYEIITLKVKLW